MSVILETSIGDMTVDLYTDERPRCCMNFLKLCKMKYYNFSLFHSVQKDLVAQTGDPTATGRGGESIFGFLYGEQARFFEMEVVPRILHNKKGLLSMVNNGSGMHGSQFFITLADSVDYLNNKHTVFGEVAEDLETVEKLNNAFCDEGNRPHQDIRIYHTVILDDPYDDPDGLVIPSKSPPPTQEMLDSDRIPCDADIDDEEGMTEEQLNEMAAEREAKANTQILEMVGDLPDQDLAPPENVLFVCKLNPVTTSDDMEIIFSRFGTVVSCEVIKDQKTGESLQYAFVEFERQQDCEMAYFKMDNVLIDDRRIHVDFSQSVSKLKWKGKGKGVEIMKDGDAPKYVLKNQQRKSDGYDLVYAHDDLDEDVSIKDKSHKKHKKSTREDSHESLKNYRRDNDRQGDRKKDRYDEREKDRRDRYDDRDKERKDRYGEREKDRGDIYYERNNQRRDRYAERVIEKKDRYGERDSERRERSDERDNLRRQRHDKRDNERRDRYDERDNERRASYDERGNDRREKEKKDRYGESERHKDRRQRDDGHRRHRDQDSVTKKIDPSKEKRKTYKYDDSEENDSYSDFDSHRSKKEMDSKSKSKKSKREAGYERSEAKKKSSRKESFSDDENEKRKVKSKHKKYKSEKKRRPNSDSEYSSADETQRRRGSESDEEYRRKDKKKKRKS